MFAHRPTGIHALPVELLSRIVALGAEDDYPYSHSPFLLKPDQNYYAVPSTQFQLTVSHVCHHWRHVALRTPSLWTTLCFREVSHIPRADAYLARCSRSPNRRLDILVDTVAPKDHIPGVTLCQDELVRIFSLIMPHVLNWRAFHLKIRDNACKQIARQNLGGSGPAPNLETLQLYHFEDFREVQDLYIATYRPPVRIFSNSLPKLRNVSLIGVNLPWDQSPYLLNLHTLELALHSDNIRPPYKYWDKMLRHSPNLQRLLLHYSGPRGENGTEDLAWTSLHDGKGKGKEDECILLESLWELSLTDLDPDYLCLVLDRLVMPNVNKLSLDLPDQDFTPFVELIAPSNLSTDPAQPPTIPHHPYPNLTEFYLTSPLSSHQLHHQSYESATGSSSSPGGDSWESATTLSSSGSSTPPHSPTSTSTLSASSPSINTSTASTAATAISVNSMSNNGSAMFKRLPLPKLATTLDTLIITALECEVSSWRALIRSLVALETLEVNFWKVRVTGREIERDDGGSGGGLEWKVLIDRVMEELTMRVEGRRPEIVRRERIVLPRLRRCKITGLAGWVVRKIITEREGDAARGGCRGGVEWLVVEDKFVRDDQELAVIFGKGVWIGQNEDATGIHRQGRWIRVQKIVEEEDEDEDEGDEEEEEELEEEGEEEDTGVREGEVEEVRDEEEEGSSRGKDSEDKADEGDYDAEEEEDSSEEEQELMAEQYFGTGMGKVGVREASTSTLSSSSGSSTTIRSSMRNDIHHRGME